MDRVRIGIVGTGNIAQLNVRGYLQHPQCDVVAVCDPRRDAAEASARAWSVPKVYDQLDDLLADDEIDAVEILTPTNLHHAHVLAAARAGKHVSCQKPIGNSIAEGREMVRACADAGVVFRVSECCFHYPPLVKAKELVAEGAIGTPTMIRIKTLVGDTDSEFQRGLQPEGYVWRFNEQSPGGHLFDDMAHKYALALWLTDDDISSVQAVVRKAPLFFEAPTAAIFEYGRDDLVGTMEVAYAPKMYIRSKYYGAEEFFEIQGDAGLVKVNRCIGEMTDEPPLILYRGDGVAETFSQLDSDWGEGFVQSSRHFVDALLEGRTDPEMSGDLAIKTLQLCFAVYAASNTRAPAVPADIEGSVSPPWWPKTPEELMDDVKKLGLI
jgi:predicted dehydrogenase